MIKLLINEQALSVVTPVVVEGTDEYLTLSADFTGEHWENAVKYVHFLMGENHLVFTMTDDCIREEAQMNLPRGTWEIYVVGAVYEDEEQVQRITTETQLLEVQIEGVYGREPETDVDPYAPDEGETYLVRGDLPDAIIVRRVHVNPGLSPTSGGAEGLRSYYFTPPEGYTPVGILGYNCAMEEYTFSAMELYTDGERPRLWFVYRNSSSTDISEYCPVTVHVLYVSTI